MSIYITSHASICQCLSKMPVYVSNMCINFIGRLVPWIRRPVACLIKVSTRDYHAINAGTECLFWMEIIVFSFELTNNLTYNKPGSVWSGTRKRLLLVCIFHVVSTEIHSCPVPSNTCRILNWPRRPQSGLKIFHMTTESLEHIINRLTGATWNIHYDDVIMDTIASQITSLTIVYSAVYSGADQSKHQSSASLAFVWGIHRGPVNSPHKWPVTRKMFPFDDVIMFK